MKTACLFCEKWKDSFATRTSVVAGSPTLSAALTNFQTVHCTANCLGNEGGRWLWLALHHAVGQQQPASGGWQGYLATGWA